MIHVCYGLYDKDGRYSKFTGTSILSMFENTGAEITVHILHDNTLSADNRQNFLTIAKKYNQRINFHNVEESCAKEIAELRNKLGRIEKYAYSIGALYRFLIIQSIREEKIIYLDADTIIDLDIDELWQIELGDKPLAVVAEVDNLCRMPEYRVANTVKREDYFNSGVMLMNLKVLRNELENLWQGINFVAENSHLTLLDQDVFNYCYATRALKLPVKFNLMIGEARLHGAFEARNKICHYITKSLTLNLRDDANHMWMEYFSKTPWFTPEVMLRIYDLIQELHAQAQDKLLQLSAIMSGRHRIFFTELTNLDRFKQLFYVNPTEEIIDATKPNALNSLLEKMIENRGEEFLILLVNRYSEVAQVLTRTGFAEGLDFINATDFLSYKHGMPLDTNFLIRAI